MKYIAIFFLLLGAFLMEWSMRGFGSAWHQLKVYWRTRNDYTDEEDWR